MQDGISNWIPYKLFRENGQWLCKWLYAADKAFTEPFFDETILACKKHPYNSKQAGCVTRPEDLEGLSKSLSSLVPAAFIFHTSRCGSTLLSQLLGLDDSTISLAEVPLFDEILRLPYKEKEITADLNRALKAAISLHLQKRTGKEQQAFIKLDSWHIFFYDVIRTLYPHVPCILLYRSPDEVLASHRKHRGMQAVPGVIEPGIFGFTEKEVQGLSLDEYTAAVLERYLLKFSEIAAADPQALLLNYKEGVMPMLNRLLAHAGVTYSGPVLQKMLERSLYHSKHPEQSFSGDTKETNHSGCLEAAMAAYLGLEATRLQQRLPK